MRDEERGKDPQCDNHSASRNLLPLPERERGKPSARLWFSLSLKRNQEKAKGATMRPMIVFLMMLTSCTPMIF